MSHPPHVPYLVPSLWTLRRHWDGEVHVHAWPESFTFVQRIADDERLGVVAVEREPHDGYRGKNSQFLDKIQLVRSLQGAVDVALYLDADTTIHGNLGRLFDEAAEHGFCATQFCDWTIQKGIPRKRVMDLLEVPCIDPDLIGHLLSYAYPSVNGGVWTARPESPVLPLWYSWTMEATLRCENKFIADEKVLHVLQVKFPDDMTVLLGGAWNCSPMRRFQPNTLYDDQVTVRHYHGDSNCRPSKCGRGLDMWWTAYWECWQQNVGGIRDWRDQVRNKYLDPVEKERRARWRKRNEPRERSAPVRRRGGRPPEDRAEGC